jgi:hypothetical protein
MDDEELKNVIKGINFFDKTIAYKLPSAKKAVDLGLSENEIPLVEVLGAFISSSFHSHVLVSTTTRYRRCLQYT